MLDDLPWKRERGPSSVRRTWELFRRQRLGVLRDGWSAYWFSERTDTTLNWAVAQGTELSTLWAAFEKEQKKVEKFNSSEAQKSQDTEIASAITKRPGKRFGHLSVSIDSVSFATSSQPCINDTLKSLSRRLRQVWVRHSQRIQNVIRTWKTDGSSSNNPNKTTSNKQQQQQTVPADWSQQLIYTLLTMHI